MFAWICYFSTIAGNGDIVEWKARGPDIPSPFFSTNFGGFDIILSAISVAL